MSPGVWSVVIFLLALAAVLGVFAWLLDLGGRRDGDQ
jgi:ABC-type transporter Mla subunit MlaD